MTFFEQINGGADTFFRIYFGLTLLFRIFLWKFFRMPIFLTFFKEKCRNIVVSAVWIWGAGRDIFCGENWGGEMTFFGPKNNGFPG